LVDAAGVVHDWFRLRHYTNKKTGQPVPLRVAELRRLIRKRFPQRSVDAVLAWMQENGFIQPRSRGSFVLSVDRQVIIGQPRALALERAANLAPQLLKTALRNARTPKRQDRDVHGFFASPRAMSPNFGQCPAAALRMYWNLWTTGWRTETLLISRDKQSRHQCMFTLTRARRET
jgi:hypothetical protein